MAPCWTPAGVLTNIDNSSCSITCAGYASYQGRRCHCAIAAENRQDAARILYRMSMCQLSSSRIIDFLNLLASRVLCKKNHQNQSRLIVSQWQEDIDDLREREAARQAAIIARREREAATVASRTRTTSDNPAPRNAQSPSIQIERLARELDSMAARVRALEEECQELRRSRRTQYFVVSQAATLEAGEDNNSELDQVALSEYDTAPISPLSSDEGTVEEEEDDDNDDEDDEGDEEEEDQDGQGQEQLEHQHDGTIEGECSICLENLGTESDLTFCRQCDQLFHLDCLGIWLATDEHTQTCPCCRINWVE